MIKRVYAYLNDCEDILEFSHCEGNRWIISNIPQNMRGQYYLDIFAEDDARNVGFISTAIFEVDPFGLCVSFKILNKDFTVKLNEFEKKCNLENYIVNAYSNRYIAEFKGFEFNMNCKEVTCI